ncbi:hypothetical protein [Qipengyuania sp.]|uniref:hypothetical protein n=1 Tax=Qipengyuania sp. TaxID=2004515 RepID=UPI0037368A2D
MKLTKVQRYQLRKMVEGLADYSLEVLTDDQMRDWLGLDFIKYAEEGIAATLKARSEGYRAKATATNWPREVHSYFDVRKLAERNARNLPARIATQKRIIEAATRKIVGMEQAHEAQVKGAWRRYHEVQPRAPWWFVPGTEEAGLPPNIWGDDNPPYEAVMDGEMNPRRRSQIEAITRLLETGNDQRTDDLYGGDDVLP